MSVNGNGTLEPKQLRFIEEFTVDCNATQAAIRAGYSQRTARQIGYENLTKPYIQQAIKNRMEKHTEAVGVTVERVLKELVRMAWVDIGEAYDENQCLKPLSEIPEDVRRAIVSIETDEIWEWEGSGEDRKRVQVGVTKKIKFADKRGSNELLGKYLKMFVERHEFGLTDDLLDLMELGRKRAANGR
jgi:phage terminase small subunit